MFANNTIAKFSTAHDNNWTLSTASFYFSSDNLSSEGNSYIFEDTFTFELYNYQDTNYTDYNIEYEISFTDIITSGSEAITITDSNSGVLQGNTPSTSVINVTPHEDIASFNLSVAPIFGFKKTLRSFYERPQNHTVIFNGNGGTLISGEEIQTVDHGGFAIAPVYEKEGFLLSGWSEDINNITEDLNVSAIWQNYFNYTVDISGDVTITGLNAYYNLDTLTVPTTIDDNGTLRDVVAIGNSAFQFKTSLKEVIIPYGINIGQTILRSCTGLTTLTAPFDTTNITTLNYYFGTSNPSLLKTVNIAEGTVELGYQAFFSKAIEFVSIPDSLQIIGENAFKACASLHTVNISENSQLTTIEEDAFYNADLYQLYLPDSLQTIGSYAFSSNTNLTNVRIPAGVTQLGYDPFGNCSGLTYVIIDAPTPPTAKYSIFNNCTLLEHLYVAPASVLSYQTAYGWKDTNTLYNGYSEITFETNGGDAIAPIIANDNTPLPDATGRVDVFDGWYTDETFTTEYNFDTLTSTKITVYAKWI